MSRKRSRSIAALIGQQNAKLAALISRGIDEGWVLADVGPEHASTALWAMMNGVISLMWRPRWPLTGCRSHRRSTAYRDLIVDRRYQEAGRLTFWAQGTLGDCKSVQQFSTGLPSGDLASKWRPHAKGFLSVSFASRHFRASARKLDSYHEGVNRRYVTLPERTFNLAAFAKYGISAERYIDPPRLGRD
ncbi:hypothetical protein [Burkholderia contaminans]|uniref:hypothetical protein n=2 Tax=Burkholderiaceae TaxID=119060 RepID=UPI001FC85283|nr:hypothetical protein [Burkholderia contaminans]